MPPRVEKVERVADLLLILLNAKEPLTLVQIGSQVRGYPTEEEARRTQFERDKRTLRESGVPITVSAPNSSAQDGYQILAADYYLPDLNLTDAERDALRFALSSVRLEGTAHAEIAVKIGAEPESAIPPVMELPRVAGLGEIGEAIRDRAPLTFRYRDRTRDVEPELLVFRSGHWYLIGRDAAIAEKEARRTFRVDRINGPVRLGAKGTVVRDRGASFDRELAFSLRANVDDDGDNREAHEVLQLLVDPSATASVIELVGKDAVLERDDLGRARVQFPIADEQAVIAWVLGLGAAAEVVEPVHVRTAVIDRLRAIAEEAPRDHSRLVLEDDHAKDVERPPASQARKPVLDAGARLRRMIALLTFLASEGHARIADLAERFAMDDKTVVDELELAACFGLPPYTPDQLLEILVIDDEVHVHRLEALERPLRLTPDEGFALAAAARTLLDLDGVGSDSPLARALEKLEAVLGEDNVRVDVDIPPLLGELREAAATSTVLEIDYPTADGIKATRRRVEPYAVVFREGKFYLDAYCHLRRDWRRFLISNVSYAKRTSERTVVQSPPHEFFGNRAFVERASMPRATIVMPTRSQYFVESLASHPPTQLDEDRSLVTLAVGDERWLGNLLLRLGDDAHVVRPEELRRAKADAASAALRRYGHIAGD